MKCCSKKSFVAALVVSLVVITSLFYVLNRHANQLLDITFIGKDSQNRYIYETKVAVPRRGQYSIYIMPKDMNVGFGISGLPRIVDLDLATDDGQISCFDPYKAALVFDSQKNIHFSFDSTDTDNTFFKIHDYRYGFSSQTAVNVKFYSLNQLETSNLKLSVREKLDAL